MSEAAHDAEDRCGFCSVPLENFDGIRGGYWYIELTWYTERTHHSEDTNQNLCERCGEAVRELVRHWTRSDPYWERQTVHETFFHASDCCFCGDSLEGERGGCHFGHTAEGPRDYTFCRDCYEIVRMFLRQVRDERQKIASPTESTATTGDAEPDQATRAEPMRDDPGVAEAADGPVWGGDVSDDGLPGIAARECPGCGALLIPFNFVHQPALSTRGPTPRTLPGSGPAAERSSTQPNPWPPDQCS